MSMQSGQTEGDLARADAARVLLRRVALVLVADARGPGAFEDDEEALRARVAALVEAFAADPPEAIVEMERGSSRRIRLKASFDKSWTEATVHSDGVIKGGGVGRRGMVRTVRPEDMTPEELEEKARRDLAVEAGRGKPKFRGRRYLRTLVAAPQPGAALRVLAVGLYADGLIVEFTYDNEPKSAEQMRAEAERPYLQRRPPMSLADDLGTKYYESGVAGYGGGFGGSFAHFGFAPAVPADATVLRITTESGTVELDLKL